MASLMHKEAFCLMNYRDEETGEVEQLWNSRDGVTPFCISSRDGKRTMHHTNFNNDKFKPGHEPFNGQRIFKDLTNAKALEIATAEVERDWEQSELGAIKDDGFLGPMGKKGAANHLAKSYYKNGKQPFIDTYISPRQG